MLADPTTQGITAEPLSMLKANAIPDRQILASLPIFPLPNVVLLPGMVLPLNIFEPRYLDLVDFVRTHGQHIGVPLLCPAGAATTLSLLLAAVAAISLVVGGIGIMNIMLVSVTERTREIGIRLAIGALEREVLLQFLIEAVVLAALGGLIGIVLATGASIGLSALMKVPYIFNPGVNLLSFFFSAGIGVLFGYFPARRAARMDPIDALRHE